MSDYQLLPDLLQLLPSIPADSIISRTLYQDRTLRVMLFGFAPGQVLSEHTTPMTATLQFLTGRATVTLGEDRFELGAGAWAQMPPKLPHSIQAQDEPVLMVLTMINPAKE